MVIGVTGGTGSGKSTVAKILKHLGAKVINADKVAREVVCKGQKAYNELLAYFGNEIVDENGEINRKKLASIVFNDPQKLETLNAITHKYIAEKIAALICSYYRRNSSEVIVVDAPLPIRHGFLDLVDKVWVVTADKETRVKRVMERDGLSAEEAVSRINSQMSEAEYLKLADEVLVNNGNVEELEKETVRLFFKIKNG